jgi:predicted ArsR family transcriptional regulator
VLVWNGDVDAAPVRRHLRKLSRRGVGYKSVAAACDVSKTILLLVLTGRKRAVRKRTADRVLAVTRDAIADAGLVDARPTWKLLDELLQEDTGFTRAELARRLGYRTPALQLRHGKVLARTALRVARLYRELMEGDERLERVYRRAVA